MLRSFRSAGCLSKRLQEFNSGGNKVKTKKTSLPLSYLLRANHTKKRGQQEAQGAELSPGSSGTAKRDEHLHSFEQGIRGLQRHDITVANTLNKGLWSTPQANFTLHDNKTRHTLCLNRQKFRKSQATCDYQRDLHLKQNFTISFMCQIL